MDYANGGSGTYYGSEEDRPVNDSRVPPDEEITDTTTNNTSFFKRAYDASVNFLSEVTGIKFLFESSKKANSSFNEAAYYLAVNAFAQRLGLTNTDFMQYMANEKFNKAVRDIIVAEVALVHPSLIVTNGLVSGAMCTATLEDDLALATTRFKFTTKADGKGTKAGQGLLKDALDGAVSTGGHPAQVMNELDDGTRVLFRKDFGQQSHSIGGPFQGQEKVDHFNLQIQNPNGKTLENIHIVPDGNGGFIWWGKNGVIKQ